MKKIKATIEKGADGGYGIYAEGGIPLFAGGATEDEAKADFEAMVPEQAEHIRERTGSYPDWYAPGVGRVLSRFGVNYG